MRDLESICSSGEVPLSREQQEKRIVHNKKYGSLIYSFENSTRSIKVISEKNLTNFMADPSLHAIYQYWSCSGKSFKDIIQICSTDFLIILMTIKKV